jgi:L-ascorbate 6-phosphate lactonase
MHDLKKRTVEPGSIAICSLGQAGYVYKFSQERYMLIDPYVTDSCEKRIGSNFKRLMPSIVSPEELDTLPITAYLITHHHEDHLDVDCIERMASTHFPFYAPPDTIQRLIALGISADRCFPLSQGSTYELHGIQIVGTYANHGDLAPDAVGILVESEGRIIYHMGDTCLNEAQWIRIGQEYKVDLLLTPINGKYGNMDEIDAAKAVSLINPQISTPCHFWMLPGNSGGDPILFIEQSAILAPNTKVFMMTQGEIICITQEGIVS